MAIITATKAKPYDRIVDVLVREFGCPFKGFQRGFWKPKGANAVVWFPKISASLAGRNDCDWLNLFVASQCKEFVSEWAGESSKANGVEVFARTWMHHDQVVFANLPGTHGYRFLGVYRCRVAKDGKRHYMKVSDSVNTAPLQYP